MKLFARIRIPYSTLYVALLVLGSAYLLNLITRGVLTQWLALEPSLVRQGEWWRIVSYPLAMRSFLEMFLVGFVLYLFATDFEQLLGKSRLWRFVTLTLLTEGLLYAIVMYPVAVPLESPVAVVLALLTWRTMRTAQLPVSILGWFILPLWQLWILVVLLALIPEVLHVSSNPLLILRIIVVQGFGIAAGVLLYVLTATAEERAVKAVQRSVQYREREERKEPQLTAGEEEELNRLLDKIAAAGYDALTRQEKKRLRELSQKL